MPQTRGATSSELTPSTPARDDDVEDAIFQILSIKGSATREALTAALEVGVDDVASIVDRLVTTGDLAPAKPLGFRASETGRARASALLELDRERLGAAMAREALLAFQPFDRRMKNAVTDWQLRIDGAERVANDHTNARWDASVVERLSTLCGDAEKQLDSEIKDLRRHLESWDELDRRFGSSVRDHFNSQAEGVFDELKQNEAVKIAFARKKLVKTIEAQKSKVRDLRASYCDKCFPTKLTPKNQASNCEKCPDKPECK